MSRAEIKRRYISLAKETHPDSSPAARIDDDRFNEIARAWTVLSDPKTRRAHDRELAAADFKDDFVRRAEEVAREYGPSARKFYDDFAIPFLRRTTATTLAGWSAVAEVTSEAASEREKNGRGAGEADGSDDPAASLSEMVKEVSEMERANAGGGGDALEDFGKAFQRVFEAAGNATRQIDGMELQEKSAELRERADETRAESMEVLARLNEIKSERLRLTFHTSSANFTSKDAIQYLDGFNGGIVTDDVTLMQRISFKQPMSQSIEAFTAAESEFDKKAREKSEVDQKISRRHTALQKAEKAFKAATEAEERARRVLEEAEKRVVTSQKLVAEAKQSIRDLYVSSRKADQELSKARTALKRKRDAVRRELKKKADTVEGPMFDEEDDGNVRLNPGFDRSSMNDMGFEDRNLAAIEALLKDERKVEGEFLKLVDKASRLMSRSERLRLRSEELIGERARRDDARALDKENQQQAANGAGGEVIGDNFQGSADRQM